MLKFAVVVLVTVLLVVLVFLGGMWVGSRANAETVSNAELHEKVNQEAASLNKRFDAVDAKLDILLNIATNAVGRDFRPR
jgi:cytochrome oxidase assembly protein ShyY1